MQNKKIKIYLITLLSSLVLFIIYTIVVKFIDVSSIGPNDSKVGFSHLNELLNELIQTNLILYQITDWAGLGVIALGFIYFILGIIQLRKRRSIKDVDTNLIALGIFYILVFLVYILFEYIVINSRPVLIDGYLEASYPSSTTILSLCFLLSSIDQVNVYIKNDKKKFILKITLVILAILMVLGRLLSGVHWLTDIIGGSLISLTLLVSYYLIKLILDKRKGIVEK